jgi:hypothetical protein
MKFKNFLITSVVSALLLNSCEKIANEDGYTAVQIEGQWKCEENSSVYKSALDFYTVYISLVPGDSSRIRIKNFYQLGNDVTVEATVSGLNLTIPSQTVSSGFTFQGEGTVKSNYNEISWSYTVNDGSGEVDQVTATYSKLQ